MRGLGISDINDVLEPVSLMTPTTQGRQSQIVTGCLLVLLGCATTQEKPVDSRSAAVVSDSDPGPSVHALPRISRGAVIRAQVLSVGRTGFFGTEERVLLKILSIKWMGKGYGTFSAYSDLLGASV